MIKFSKVQRDRWKLYVLHTIVSVFLIYWPISLVFINGDMPKLWFAIGVFVFFSTIILINTFGFQKPETAVLNIIFNGTIASTEMCFIASALLAFSMSHHYLLIIYYVAAGIYIFGFSICEYRQMNEIEFMKNVNQQPSSTSVFKKKSDKRYEFTYCSADHNFIESYAKDIIPRKEDVKLALIGLMIISYPAGFMITYTSVFSRDTKTLFAALVISSFAILMRPAMVNNWMLLRVIRAFRRGEIGFDEKGRCTISKTPT